MPTKATTFIALGAVLRSAVITVDWRLEAEVAGRSVRLVCRNGHVAFYNNVVDGTVRGGDHAGPAP